MTQYQPPPGFRRPTFIPFELPRIMTSTPRTMLGTTPRTMDPVVIAQLPDYYALSLLLDVTVDTDGRTTLSALREIQSMTEELGIVMSPRRVTTLGSGLTALAMASHANQMNIEALLLTARGIARGRNEQQTTNRLLPPACLAPGQVVIGGFAGQVVRTGPENVFDLMDVYNKPGAQLSANTKMLIQDQSNGSRRGIVARDISGSLVEDSELRLLFHSYDHDGSGFIDRLEFKYEYKLFESYGVVMSDKEIDKLFSKYDKSKDGKLDFDEFAMLMLQRAKF